MDAFLKRCTAALVLCLVALAAVPTHAALAEYVPGEVLVTYADTSASIGIESAGGTQDPEEAMEELGFQLSEDLATEDANTTVLAMAPDGLSVDEAIAQLAHVPGVQDVQPNYVYRLVEPYAAEGLAASATTRANLAAAKLPAAWELAQTNHTIAVAVLDSGCRLTHEDLVNNIDAAHAWNFVETDKRGAQLTTDSANNNGDDNGHGTHVCGILAAEYGNGKGVDGASYDATIIPMKVLDAQGEGSTASVVQAINEVRSLKKGDVPNLRIINLSLGGDDYDRSFERAVNAATQEGILVVCAAGNDGNDDTTYPSDYENTLSVMALDSNQTFASYTSYNNSKDIAAVGTAYSTYNQNDSSYATIMGTSMATPLVSGVAALVWSVDPDMSATQVRNILLDTAADVPPGNSSPYDALRANGTYHDVGQVDAEAAVRTAQELVGAESTSTSDDLAATDNDQDEDKGRGETEDEPAYEGIDVPTANMGLVYNGSAQQGFATSDTYTITGATATNAGTYVALVTPNDGYMWNDDGTRDTRSVTWTILPASMAGTSVSAIGNQAYTGKAITPKPTVRFGGIALTAGTDYTLSYANNTNPGTARINLTGKGNYTGDTSTTFTIKEKQTQTTTTSQTTTTTQTKAAAATQAQRDAAAAASVRYRSRLRSSGWQAWKAAGATSGGSSASRRPEALSIKLQGAPYSGGVSYRVRGDGYGWRGWASDGAAAGTSGKSLEAVEIKLTGEMASRYDVWYRVRCSGYGWLSWASNGAAAGTAGTGRRVTAVQVRVLPKGSAAPGATTTPYVPNMLRARAKGQGYGWQAWRSGDSKVGRAGKGKRMEGLRLKLKSMPFPGGISYRARGQGYGWQKWKKNGATAGASGRRMGAVQIKLTGEMAKHYDVWYRAYCQGYGWMGWAKNGRSAGTSGKTRRLEAVQVCIRPKGSSAPGSTSRPYRK